MSEDSNKKILKSFRLSNNAVELISNLTGTWGIKSDAQVIERALILAANKGASSQSIGSRRLSIRLTNEALKKHFISTGETLDSTIEVELPLSELDSADREYIWECMKVNDGELNLMSTPVDYDQTGFFFDSDLKKHLRKHYFYSNVIPLKPDDWKIILNEHRAGYEKAKKDRKSQLESELSNAAKYIDALVSSGNFYLTTEQLLTLKPSHYLTIGQLNTLALVWDIEILGESIRRYEKNRDDWQKKNHDEQIHKKSEWIKAFGSSHLNEAFNLGYPCQQQYRSERLRRDFPGFDFLNESHSYVEVDSPTPKGLEIAKRYGGRSVILSETIVDYDGPQSHHIGEVVLVYYQDFACQLYATVRNFSLSEPAPDDDFPDLD